MPDTLTPQVPIICDVLDALGIARVGADDYEADDVIGTLASRATGAVEIVTGDRDLFQLVDDSVPIRIVYIVKGVGNREIIDEAEVARRYGIPGRSTRTSRHSAATRRTASRACRGSATRPPPR